jgi:NNP family nitrate/nitrite transporter-like MFS transporter
MGFKASDLWRTPTVNPVNKKARSVPILNPIDAHGRVFFFSWLGFMLSFWAWYTFPPLLSVTIKHDLNLTSQQVANSNIVSLVATLAVRFAAGPLCDQFGPRRVFSLLLLVGSIPIGLAPLIKDATGLYIIRLFIGILGGAFVPCQVWCTGWFDKNVVGTANALAGGWGNAGGGITYFIMPAVFDSLVHRWGHSPDQAWRITFVVPLVCLITCGIGLLLLCEDTPMGTWYVSSSPLLSQFPHH